jgi:hypothetical protein
MLQLFNEHGLPVQTCESWAEFVQATAEAARDKLAP